jgi:hypothetical protein
LRQIDFQFSSGPLLKYVRVAIGTLEFVIRVFCDRVLRDSALSETSGDFRRKPASDDYNDFIEAAGHLVRWLLQGANLSEAL